MDSISLLTKKIEQEQKQIAEHQNHMQLIQSELKDSWGSFKVQLQQELDSTQKNMLSQLKGLNDQTGQDCQMLLTTLQEQTQSADQLCQESVKLLSTVQDLVKQAQKINLDCQEQQKQQQEMTLYYQNQQKQQQSKQQINLVLSASCVVLAVVIILILLVK